jgi:hypothetical protein
MIWFAVNNRCAALAAGLKSITIDFIPLMEAS